MLAEIPLAGRDGGCLSNEWKGIADSFVLNEWRGRWKAAAVIARQSVCFCRGGAGQVCGSRVDQPARTSLQPGTFKSVQANKKDGGPTPFRTATPERAAWRVRRQPGPVPGLPLPRSRVEGGSPRASACLPRRESREAGGKCTGVGQATAAFQCRRNHVPMIPEFAVKDVPFVEMSFGRICRSQRQSRHPHSIMSKGLLTIRVAGRAPGCRSCLNEFPIGVAGETNSVKDESRQNSIVRRHVDAGLADRAWQGD